MEAAGSSETSITIFQIIAIKSPEIITLYWRQQKNSDIALSRASCTLCEYIVLPFLAGIAYTLPEQKQFCEASSEVMDEWKLLSADPGDRAV